MSWELVWRFRAAGGALPGGLWGLLAALALLWFVLAVAVRPTGALRERGLAPVGLVGSALLVAAFVLLRAWTAPPPSVPRLAVWPFAGLDGGRGAAEAARIEETLADAPSGAPRPVVCRFLLPPGPRVVDGPAAAEALMEALDLRWLLSAVRNGDSLRLSLRERRWSTLREAGVRAVDPAAGRDAVPRAAFALLAEAGLLDALPAIPPLPDAWWPLYAPVADSASLWLDLPRGHLPLRQDLRRASLGVQLGAPASEIVPAVNRALAAGDSAGAEPWLLAARWFARQGEWETARQALVNALGADPLDPRTHWLLAHLNESSLREFGYADRWEALGRTLALQPVHRAALLELAPRWLDLRRGAEAAVLVDRGLAALPDDTELRLLRANLAYGLLDHARAEALYLELVRDVPDDPRAWLNLGQLRYMLGLWDAAAGPLERAVALGSPPETLHLLGVCRSRLGQRDEAVALFRRRMKLGGTREELERTRRELAALFPELQPGAAEPRP